MNLCPIFLSAMRIALTIVSPEQNNSEGYPNYVKEISTRIVNAHPEDEFLFVLNQPYADTFVFASNITPIVVLRDSFNLFTIKYWYDFQVPHALRNIKVDLWIQLNGFCSLTTKIPQILLVQSSPFLQDQQAIVWYNRWYHQFLSKKFIKKANSLIALTETAKKDLIVHHQLKAIQINVINAAADAAYQPLEWQDKEQVKDGFTDGREYFLFKSDDQSEENVLNMFKAFSYFKKWQQSNMKLLVLLRPSSEYHKVETKIKTYKYREDVILLNHLSTEQLVRITSTAYAIIIPSSYFSSGQSLLNAMKSEVPIIVDKLPVNQEIGGAAVLSVNFSDPEEMAKGMLTLYKDETKRNSLIKSGLEQVATYNWDKAADQFWQIISNTPQKV